MAARKKARAKKVEWNNNNTGALWVNADKKSAKHPAYTGNAEIVCPHCDSVTVHRMAAWDRDSSNESAPIMGLEFTIPQPKRNRKHG